MPVDSARAARNLRALHVAPSHSIHTASECCNAGVDPRRAALVPWFGARRRPDARSQRVSLQQRTNTEQTAPVVQAPPAALAMSQRQIILVFVALMLGMLLAALDQTIVSTALPTMVGELGGLEHL